MYCPKCGNVIPDTANFCNVCGAPVSGGQPYADAAQVPVQHGGDSTNGSFSAPPYEYNDAPVYGNQNNGYNYDANGTMQPEPGMKWYGFVINFQLFVSALFGLYNAYQYLTGRIYALDSVSVSQIYSYFRGLRALDIVMGIAYIALAVFAIVTRQALAKLRKQGPTMLYAYLGFQILILVIYLIAGAGIANVPVSSLVNPGIIGNIGGIVLTLIVDFIYFNKRSYLFVN